MPKKASLLLSGFSGSGAKKQMITSVRPSVRAGERETGEREITTLVFAHFIITEGRQKEAALHVIELGHLKMGMGGHHCPVSNSLQIRSWMVCLLGCSKGFGQRLPSNIGWLLHKL